MAPPAKVGGAFHYNDQGMGYMRELREALTEMTESVSTQPYERRLEQLSKKHPNTILLIEEGEVNLLYYNCFAYALAIQGDPTFLEMVQRSEQSQTTVANSRFMESLLRSGLLVPADKALPGGLALYFNNYRLTHAARITDDVGRYQSKWGSYPIHQHDPLEVPSSYGDDIRFYCAVNTKDVLGALVQYFIEQGG